MNGVQHYLWRAVDQRGVCLGVLVTRRRDTYATRKFLRRLLKSPEYTPRVLSTDKLRSYDAAKREVMASVEHRQSKYLNNRAENSHQSTRQREYAMRRFASPGHALRFCAVHDPVYQHFRPTQRQLDAASHRDTLTDRHDTWNQITGDLLLSQCALNCGLRPARDRHSRTSQDGSNPRRGEQPDNAVRYSPTLRTNKSHTRPWGKLAVLACAIWA